MQILRAHDFRTTPWKNGGGETTQIAVRPLGAGLEDFDWRVSTARVASDGPFSHFPGVDRTLAVLTGAGLRLSIEGRSPIVLTSRAEPFAFAGDIEAAAVLVDGAITDLNVMTRRARFSHRVRRIQLGPPASFGTAGIDTLLYCAHGALRAKTAEIAADLGPGDALLSPCGGTCRLQAEVDALAYFIEFLDAPVREP